MKNLTYHAILKGNRLEWQGAAPPELGAGEVAVDVTIVRPQEQGAGERMAAALERIAASRAVDGIQDPVAWQREIRRDRPLPDRD